MGGLYDKDIFKQLQEFMERSDRIDKKIHDMKVEHKTEVRKLNDRIDFLEKENDGLRNDNKYMLQMLIPMTNVFCCIE